MSIDDAMGILVAPSTLVAFYLLHRRLNQLEDAHDVLSRAVEFHLDLHVDAIERGSRRSDRPAAKNIEHAANGASDGPDEKHTHDV